MGAATGAGLGRSARMRGLLLPCRHQRLHYNKRAAQFGDRMSPPLSKRHAHPEYIGAIMSKLNKSIIEKTGVDVGADY